MLKCSIKSVVQKKEFFNLAVIQSQRIFSTANLSQSVEVIFLFFFYLQRHSNIQTDKNIEQCLFVVARS